MNRIVKCTHRGRTLKMHQPDRCRARAPVSLNGAKVRVSQTIAHKVLYVNTY